jgi:hypothetical protein
MREKVVEWISSGMDYDRGINLLVSITRKPDSGNQYLGRGKYPKWNEKLAYEVLKASRLANVTNWRKFIEDVKQGIPVETIVSSSDSKEIEETKGDQKQGLKIDTAEIEKTESLQGSKSLEEYPPVIRRIIHEYASMFQERGKFHRVMSEIPESNAESVISKREEIFNVIKLLSSKLEQLYLAKTVYDKDGTLPDEKILFPETEKNQKGEGGPDETELKKQKKNLQSANSKDQTILDYQSKERGENKNPMPEGPKRVKIEMRINERNKRIEEIDTQLLKYAVKN